MGSSNSCFGKPGCTVLEADEFTFWVFWLAGCNEEGRRSKMDSSVSCTLGSHAVALRFFSERSHTGAVMRPQLGCFGNARTFLDITEETPRFRVRPLNGIKEEVDGRLYTATVACGLHGADSSLHMGRRRNHLVASESSSIPWSARIVDSAHHAVTLVELWSFGGTEDVDRYH
jgi:hypothetical protein